jgi:hypothetical protein
MVIRKRLIWKGLGRKMSWPNFEVLSPIRLEGLRITTENLNQYSRSPGRDLGPTPPKYEEVLTTRPQRSVCKSEVRYCATSVSWILHEEHSVALYDA